MEARQVLLSALQASPSNVDILIALLKDTLKTRDQSRRRFLMPNAFGSSVPKTTG